jgi:inorganic phosphate transporter, PiT family
VLTILLFLATCFLAYSNGANDNFKGVASLFGGKVTSYRTAIGWATVTTFAGSVAAIFLAQALLAKFSGKGLVPDALVGDGRFLLAVAVGAGLTVILATFAGFPISTTHGLTGAMLGAGLVAVGRQVDFSKLGKSFVLPLVLSPVLAVALGAIIYFLFRFVRLKTGVTKEWCVCAGTECEQVVAMPQPAGVLAFQPATPPIFSVTADETAVCAERYAGSFAGVRVQTLVDAGHFLSAGMVSFARGLNDTPKMAAMLLLVKWLDIKMGMVAVAVAIAVGGLLNARRVAETMSHKITEMNAGQGFAANLATGLLVIAASKFGLPVSTTHVSVGALFGIGTLSGKANYRVVGGILLSWFVTLPVAALLGGGVFWVATRF